MGIKFHWFRYVNYVALTQCCFGTNLVFTAGSVRYTRSDQAASLQLSDNHFYWIYSNSVYRLYYFLSTLNPQQLVTTTLTLEASLVTNGMDNLLNYHMYIWLCLRSASHISPFAYKLASHSCPLPATSSMAPKSHSAKSACVSKAKSTSSATKIKQELLKGCKLSQ